MKAKLTIEELIVRDWARWRSGAIPPEPCQVCKNVKVQAHHDDYNKPDDVTWLCQAHHAERHRIITVPKITEATLLRALSEFEHGTSVRGRPLGRKDSRPRRPKPSSLDVKRWYAVPKILPVVVQHR